MARCKPLESQGLILSPRVCVPVRVPNPDVVFCVLSACRIAEGAVEGRELVVI